MITAASLQSENFDDYNKQALYRNPFFQQKKSLPIQPRGKYLRVDRIEDYIVQIEIPIG